MTTAPKSQPSSKFLGGWAVQLSGRCMRVSQLIAFAASIQDRKPHDSRSTSARMVTSRMRYWWVNQNQTFRHEVEGGYLWSPKRNANGARNPFYDFLREVAPGDIVFSFVDTRIAAVGTARSYCWESPKPSEFGAAGQYWEDVGWRGRVSFERLENLIRPKDHIDLLRPLLPDRYSPLQPNGNGLQSVYLTEVPQDLAEVLVGLIGDDAKAIILRAAAVVPEPADDLDVWEGKIEQLVTADITIAETDRVALVRARRGQEIFRDRVAQIERRCRVTGVENPAHLVASHCKPWRDATNMERLDGENGLLRTPSIDHLFDRGFIGFENDGRLIISPVAHQHSLARMGIRVAELVNVGAFSSGQRRYLEFHRDAVLLRAARR